ncbi:MAG: hypothetical protein ACJA2D_001970 [Pseudohongiellaceae bacterium]|jgi:hypothetical protein
MASSCLQEARISPQDFIHEAAKRNEDAVLLTLWPRHVSPRNPKHGPFPDAGGYIQHFIAANWNIQDIVTLDNPMLQNLPRGIIANNYDNNHIQSFNRLVSNKLLCFTLRYR